MWQLSRVEPALLEWDPVGLKASLAVTIASSWPFGFSGAGDQILTFVHGARSSGPQVDVR